MDFLTLLTKTLIAEIVYVVILLGTLTYITPNNRDRNNLIVLSGDLDSNRITINSDIYFGNVTYGETSLLNIKLKRRVENQFIGEILTECSCTEYRVLYPQNGTDSITIQITMRAVEYGKQIRRVHIYPSTNENCEAKSLTLIADVQ